MVDSGQADIVNLGYENPGWPRLGLEAMTFRQLCARTREHVALSPIRADFHQLTVVHSGHCTAMVDFITQDCQDGTVLHVRPGQVQRLPAAPGGGLADIDATVLLFTPDFPPPTSRAAALPDLQFGPAALTAPPAERDALRQAAAELESEYRLLATRDPAAAVISVELLRQLLGAALLRIARLPHPPGTSPAEASEVFRAFQHEVERSYAATRDVQDYAIRLGYAPRSLTRASLAAAGKTAKQFIDARVTLEAKRLLVHTDLPVAAIGHAVGFTEPTNFGKFFTRQAGTTPGAFRAQESL
jgi:AraC-like DNA-binding protein